MTTSQEALTDADIKRIHDTQACLPDLAGLKDQWPEILRFARAVIDADRKARQHQSSIDDLEAAVRTVKRERDELHNKCHDMALALRAFCTRFALHVDADTIALCQSALRIIDPDAADAAIAKAP